jgi:2-polyprenyl-3-methyl-5-hydroxy-6-metoxy-1,4-benzoquinol methylase
MASMPHTASEQTATPRYDFSFAWESSYGHAVELLERLGLERGVVVDLGCGVGSIAEPLLDLGFEYIGVDIDVDSLEQLEKRGLESRELDLGQTDELAKQMLELAGGRRVAAVLLLDVIEHLPETRAFLTAVREGLELLGRPPLFVSVPNVAHVDLGAKLVFGKWEYTTTGLLDSTHTQFFTSERLRLDARACGLLELDAHDFKLRVSDQHFPADHTALSWSSPIAHAIRTWRESADPHGETIQFIRAFVPCDTEASLRTRAIPPDTTTLVEAAPLAVVMRTQGKRASHLRDALTCLAAQTMDSFEVLLMVHSDDAEPALGEVRALVADFEPAFASRVSIVHVSGGRRARPLNAALERLKADYVAFLDDDDLVMANWVESFVAASGDGAIVRSGVAVRQVSAPEDEAHCHPYTVLSALQFRYRLDFDLLRHFWENETPICTFAVPRSLIESVGLRFDEDLPVLEDWDFLMRSVAFASVQDTHQVTSVYQMWRSGESSASLHEVDVWQATQRVLQDRMNLRPLVLPAGSTDRLAKMCERLTELDATKLQLETILEATRHEAASLRNEARRDERIVADAAALIGELERIRGAYEVTVNSRRWRLLGPPARAVAAVRGALRRLLGGRGR